MSDKIFEVEKELPRRRAFIRGELRELYPGDVVRIRSRGIIMRATVETRTGGGAVVYVGTTGA